MANRVLYCAGGTEGEEVVVEDSECSDFPKPTAVVSCNAHSCPARQIAHKHTHTCHVKSIFAKGKIISISLSFVQVEGIQDIALLRVL